jgi:nucleoside-diphosphate-sugar epimerase
MIDINKRIFITWATWFIGANILHRLISLWAKDVHILTRIDSDYSRIHDLKNRVVIHTFSIEDKEETVRKIKEIWPQIVFHIAATGTAVWRAPLTIDDLIQSNTLGTMHLIDASIEAGTCEIFVNTGSSSEYWQKEYPMKETDIIEPNNLYGISKAAATQYATLMGKQGRIPLVTYRVFSAYWPYEDKKRLLPTLLDAFIHNISPQLSSPYSVRDFIYIWDIVSAFMESDRAVIQSWDIINLGTGVQSSIWDVVKELQSIFSSSLNPEYGNKQIHQLEPKSWVAEITKMKTILKIEPTPLREGLVEMLQWMKQ